MYEFLNILAQDESGGAADVIIIAVAIFFLLVVLVAVLLMVKFFRLWLQAKLSRADVKFSELIGMWLRRVDARTIVLSKITAIQAGLTLTTKDLESHYLAGGRVPNVVRALVAANRANIDLSLQTATAIDLAGRDVLEAVQVSVNPKVINTPRVAAMAKDGIQLIALARVTVRANIDRLVGGAGEETILAWGKRGGGCGTNMSFNYGNSPDFGAVGHWCGQDIGWQNPGDPIEKVPAPGVWHHLAHTYDGTTTHRINFTGCGSSALQEHLQEIHDKEEAKRHSDAEARSAAIDPFNRPIDLDCDK